MSRFTRVAFLFVVVIILAASAVVAFAAEQAPTLQAAGPVAQTAVDFSPIITAVIQIIAAVIALVGVPAALYLLNLIRSKMGLAAVELTVAQRAEADAVWRKVVGYGVQQTDGLTAQMAASGALSVDVRSAFIKKAFDYGIQHFPEVLARAKVVDSRGLPDYDQLGRILDARLGMLAISQATSPQTLATATATGDAAPKPING